MKKKAFALAVIIVVYLLALVLYVPFMSIFDGVTKVSFNVHPAMIDEHSNRFIMDHEFSQVAYEISSKCKQSGIGDVYTMYEDHGHYYFIDNKVFPFSSRWSYSAKNKGFCLRKKDGRLKINGTQCWFPINSKHWSKDGYQL